MAARGRMGASWDLRREPWYSECDGCGDPTCHGNRLCDDCQFEIDGRPGECAECGRATDHPGWPCRECRRGWGAYLGDALEAQIEREERGEER